MTPPRVARRPDALWRQSLDSVVILPAGLDGPIALAGSGSEVWNLLAEAHAVDDLVQLLADRHQVDRDVIASDVEPLLQWLLDIGALSAA